MKAADMAAKRAARAAAGTCTECDALPIPGRKLCKRHFELQQRRKQRYDRRRHDRGLCYCGQPVARGRDRCPACLAIETQRVARVYHERKARTKCVFCGRRALPGKVRCLRCTGKAAEYYQVRKRRKLRIQQRRDQLAARVFTLHAYSVGANSTTGR